MEPGARGRAAEAARPRVRAWRRERQDASYNALVNNTGARYQQRPQGLAAAKPTGKRARSPSPNVAHARRRPLRQRVLRALPGASAADGAAAATAAAAPTSCQHAAAAAAPAGASAAHGAAPKAATAAAAPTSCQHAAAAAQTSCQHAAAAAAPAAEAAAAPAAEDTKIGKARRCKRGLRKRLRMRPRPQSDLDITEALLMSIGAGESSVAHVGRLAAILANRLGDRSLEQLARVRERDLHSWCDNQPWRASVPRLYEFSMEKLSKESGRTVTAPRSHFCILPHELFASVAEHSARLREFLFGNASELEEWWRSAAECGGPWHAAVAASISSGYGRCVPIGIHGDDAGGHASSKVTVITWGSVAVARPTLDSRLVFTMLKGCDASTEEGLRCLFKVLAWSLNALAAGTWPATDESGRRFDAEYHPERAKKAGRPLVALAPAAAGADDAAVATAAQSGAYRGIWSEMRGDWKFLKEALLFKRSYHTPPNICHRCAAHNGQQPAAADQGLADEHRYSNFGRDADLRQTLEDPADWLAAAAAAENPSPLLQVRYFCVTRIFFDIMHCMDLGVFQHAVPSALAELVGPVRGFPPAAVFSGVGCGQQEARLAKATRHYRAWCKEHRLEHRAPKFSSKWVKGPYPEVSMVHSKAAEMRSNFVYWVRDVCAAAAAEHGPHGHVRAEMFNAFVRVDEACRENDTPRFLTAAAAEKLAHNMEMALKLYNALAAESVQTGTRLWRLRPKHHACTHIGYDHWRTNPRRVHCYADEDMVGRMRRVYVKCHGGTAPERALQRYIIMVGLRWARVAHAP